MDHRQRDSVLHTLTEAGMIESILVQNRGRPAQLFKVCELVA